MSGGGSEGPSYNAADGTESQASDFRNSSAAAGFTPQELAGLGSMTTGTGGQNFSSDGTDMNPILTPFNIWIAQQNATNTEHASYSNFSNSEQGRDATILTGPAVNPNSILGQPAQPQVQGGVQRL